MAQKVVTKNDEYFEVSPLEAQRLISLLTAQLVRVSPCDHSCEGATPSFTLIKDGQQIGQFGIYINHDLGKTRYETESRTVNPYDCYRGCMSCDGSVNCKCVPCHRS